MFPERADQLERFKSQIGRAPRTPTVSEPSVRSVTAARARRQLVARQIELGYDPQAVVGWRSFLVPSEIFYSTNAVPFTPEISCALLARNQAAIERSILRAEEYGYNLKQCSFLKTIVGNTIDGLLPTPNIVVASSSFCSGIGSIFYDTANHFDCQFFHLDLPLHSNAAGVVEYVAGQLKDLTRTLCAITGIDIDEVERSRLPLAVERANEAGKCWKEVEQLRKAVPSPMSGREALDFATVLSQHWGSEEIVGVYRSLRDEVRQRVDNGVAAVPEEAVRLFWLHLRPYYSDAIMDWIEDARGVVVFEEVNYPARLQLDPNDAYRSLARELLLNFGRYRVFTDRWKDDIRYVAGNFRVGGVIHFAHDNCAWSESVYPPMYRFIRDELKIPILSVDGDCLVRGRDNLMKTRVLAFVENLVNRQAKPAKPKQPREFRQARSQRRHDQYFVGIDVGSATTKVVVVDGDSTICGFSILPTGADNQASVEAAIACAQEGIGQFSIDAACGIVATGIGRGNVSTKHNEATEIICHTIGVQYDIPHVETIIDIGGQDTKAILVEQAVNRMNTSCAAGTGRFLEKIADALRITIEEMEILDGTAACAAPINKMCTVFAESEVINRVSSGADIGEIVRGVHEMVASKAATLVRQLSAQINTPIVFSGGVAKNAAVVRALQRNLGTEVRVPTNPQITGALGAALLAMETAIRRQAC